MVAAAVLETVVRKDVEVRVLSPPPIYEFDSRRDSNRDKTSNLNELLTKSINSFSGFAGRDVSNSRFKWVCVPSGEGSAL